MYLQKGGVISLGFSIIQMSECICINIDVLVCRDVVISENY